VEGGGEVWDTPANPADERKALVMRTILKPAREFAAFGLLSLAVLGACENDAAPKDTGAPAAIEASQEADAARAAQRAAHEAALKRAMAAAAASKGAGKPALWTLKDSDTTVHLLGTVHLLRPDLDWRSAEIDAALNKADTVVFEIDMASPEGSRALMAFVSEQGMDQNGRTLTSLMSDAEAADFKAAAAAADLPYEALETMRPWMAAMTLTATGLEKVGFDPAAGVDSVLEADARRAGKTLAYLETPEQQLGRLARLPEDTQMDFLLGTADSLGTMGRDLDLLTSEWADGDAKGLAALMAEPELMGPASLHEALLVARNRDWVPKIEAMLDKPGTVLVAVGAAHLVGEDSVVDLLREKGRTVAGP
jgi:uncharacterized protein